MFACTSGPPRDASRRGAPILRGFATLGAGQAAARLLTFAATLRLTHALGVDGYGAVVLGLGAMVYAALVVEFGLGHQAGLDVARDRSAAPELAGAVLLIRAPLLAIGAAALVAFAHWAPIPAVARTVTTLYALSLLPTAFHLGWAFVGAGRMRTVVAAEIATEAAFAVGVLAFVSSPAALLRVPVLYAVGTTAGAAVTWLAFRHAFGAFPRPPGRAAVTRLARAAAPLAGSGAFALLLYNFDVLILGTWIGTAAAGLYGAAYRIIQLLSFLVLQYFLAMRPVLGRASLEGYGTIADLVDRSIRITAGLAIGAAVGGAILAQPILTFLFGSGYAPAGDAFRWLLAAFALLVVSRHHRSLLVAFGRPGDDLRAVAAAAAVNVGLNLLLIPRFGLVGAAGATVAAEVVILLLVTRAVRRAVGPAPVVRHLPRPALAALAMAAVLWAVPPVHVLARIALGGAVYLGALGAVGGITRSDLASARAAIGPDRAAEPAGGSS